MLVQRIEYQCNYSSDSLSSESNKSSLQNTLIEAMKYYSIINETEKFFPSNIVAVIDFPIKVQESNQ